MPRCQLVFYVDESGKAPALDWLQELRSTHPKASGKCRRAISQLELFGFDLRRPHFDYLRDGIHELRIRFGSVNYRILYFFHTNAVAVLWGGPTKESSVPAGEIDRAGRARAAFLASPHTHTFRGDIPDA